MWVQVPPPVPTVSTSFLFFLGRVWRDDELLRAHVKRLTGGAAANLFEVFSMSVSLFIAIFVGGGLVNILLT